MTLVKRIASVVAAIAIAAVAPLGVTGTAQAATTTFKLCNYGSDYYVDAVFPDRGGKSTYVVTPQGCLEVLASTNERFYLHVTGVRTFRTTRITPLDRTYSSGRTLVQTWASLSTFTYGKLPY
ncbi:hypothetical protein ACIGNX_01705 [Actinosynnema sp. NPDC053489]|uniref:hypothetical protein n=1 Tax=Actinosynnema sp. NPDC053489 TaxID=3363916 RepID=UPI0037C79082